MKDYNFRRKVYNRFKKHDFEKKRKRNSKTNFFFRKKKIVTH